MNKRHFNGIAQGLREAIVWARGEIELPVRRPGETQAVPRFRDGRKAMTEEQLERITRRSSKEA
jgi:hypothetical protein